MPRLLYDPAHIWRDFAWAIGPAALLASYGWKAAPLALRPLERAWAYHEGPDLIGWGSLIKDPTTPLYWHASGVFPAFQRRGYRQAIRQHLCSEAFQVGAQAVALCVLDTNPDHLTRCLREGAQGSPWRESGRVWRPAPAFTIFTLLREDAPAEWLGAKACCCFHLHEPGSCADAKGVIARER